MATIKSAVLSIPNQSSSSNKWIEWHRACKDNFGRKNANSLFVENWEKRGNVNIVDKDMQDYFSSQGVEINRTIANKIMDFPADIADTIGDFFTMSKWVSIGFAVVIGVPVLILLINVAKSPETIIKAIK